MEVEASSVLGGFCFLRAVAGVGVCMDNGVWLPCNGVAERHFRLG